jgi:hypothetical protein
MSSPSKINVIICLLSAFAAFLSVFQGSRNSLTLSQDFGQVWLTSRIILNGENPYEMRRVRELSKYGEKALREMGHSWYTPAYFPSSIILIFPYALFSFKVSAKAWLLTNLLSTVILLYVSFALISRIRVSKRTYFLLTMLFLCGTPFRVTLGNGQMSIVAMTFLVLSIFCENRGQRFLAGIFLSLSLLKYSVTLPFIFFFFFLKRKWVPLIYCGVIHISILLLLCGWMKTSPLSLVLTYINLTGEIVSSYSGIDVWSFFKDILRLANFHGMSVIGVMASSVTLISILFVCIRISKKLDSAALLSLMSMFMLFACYHRVYDYICLVFPLFWIVGLNGFVVLRILIGMGVGYFFFIQKIFSELQGYNNFHYGLWAADLAIFYLMFYAVLRLAYLLSRFKLAGVERCVINR